MKRIVEKFDIVVVGGGMAGLCAAIAAAREGSQVALVHNRPVLGGNASSEIRMHIVGADYHGTRPNARETGILEEILLENKHRNPENSWPIFDALLWEKAAFQDNLSLFLNTHIAEVEMDGTRISSVSGIQQNTEKQFQFYADVFVDATGDGMLAALSGADTTLGREGKSVYHEPHAPEVSDHYTMGNSLMLKARDMGHPVSFHCPFWANRYTEEDMQNRGHEEISSGYWWIELGGGEQRVIEDGEIIRDELLKAVFGVWDHIKNGGDHGAENYELEWVGFLPGKRESRRVLGDYVLREQDCVGAARFDDTVAYGGWPMDVHVIEGFRSKNKEANEFLVLKDVYAIPYRCYYSRNVDNLMLAGRDIGLAEHMRRTVRCAISCPYLKLKSIERLCGSTIVWRCVSRLDYGTKYCHESPTMDEGRLQRSILAAINASMSQKQTLVQQVADAMELELLPCSGGDMSMADMDRRMAELESQFQALLQQAADGGGYEAYTEQFKAIAEETASLKERRAQLANARRNCEAENQRLNNAVQTLKQAPAEIQEWNETLIRQLVETVTVVSAEEIIATLKGGTEIRQTVLE